MREETGCEGTDDGTHECGGGRKKKDQSVS